MTAIVWRSSWIERSCSIAACADSRSPAASSPWTRLSWVLRERSRLESWSFCELSSSGASVCSICLDVRLDLVAKRGELRREVLGRGRARRQCLDLVEERADLLGLRLEVRRVAAPIAASAAPAAARGEEKDESARENRPKSSSARQQRAPDCNAHPGQIKGLRRMRQVSVAGVGSTLPVLVDRPHLELVHAAAQAGVRLRGRCTPPGAVHVPALELRAGLVGDEPERRPPRRVEPVGLEVIVVFGFVSSGSSRAPCPR